jgi:tripartite-type tricarboxylate transporter receptor subunit TctC
MLAPRIALTHIVLPLLGLGWTSDAFAQDWPTRPVTLEVHNAAGGTGDGHGRTLTQSIDEILGQQGLVENVGGAGGMTGSLRVARSAPDGYQMVIGNLGSHGVNQTLYKRPLYNSMTDFAPVGLVNQGLYVLMVRKDFPASTLPEFIAYAKANQDKLQFGSGGAGSTTHMVCILLNMALGINTTHIPYRGTGPALQDLAGGRLDYQCEPVPTALPLIQGHNAKPIALLASKRTKVLPDIPTAEEQGLKDFEVLSWNALFLPKGTPEPIVRRLNAAMVEALDTPWVRERLEKLGLEVPEHEQRTPEYLAKFLESEIRKWAAPIKASGVSVE